MLKIVISHNWSIVLFTCRQ